MAKLTNDPGLCDLSEKALKGFLAEQAIHPCKRRHIDINTDTEMYDDYADLLNTVQRHTRPSTAYCLSKKNKIS